MLIESKEMHGMTGRLVLRRIRQFELQPNTSKPSSHFWSRIGLCSMGLLIFLTLGCNSRNKLPAAGSKTYSEFVTAFYTGLAALQVGDDVRADTYLSQATQIVPGEPAAWGNWGILALRQRNFDAAGQRFAQAQKLAPQNDTLYYLMGLLEAGRGNTAQAIANFRKAIEIDPKNMVALYQLAEEVERQGDPGSEEEFQKLMQRIVLAQPDNLAALLELSRIAAKRGDAATLRQTVASINSQSKEWPLEVQQQLATLDAAAAGPDPRSAAMRTTFLRNSLMRVPAFRQSLAAIKPAPGDEAQPFLHFLRMDAPVFTAAPADTAMTFDLAPLDNSADRNWTWIGALSLTSDGKPVVVKANGTTVQLATGATIPFPGGQSKVSPAPEGIVPIDFNYDFKTDLVLVGAGGIRFFRQEKPEAFTDVTAQTKLPPAILNGHYTGAWAVDIEADGDLDLVVGAQTGLPLVLRNNGDGTFTQIQPFSGVNGVRGFVWADLNGDGNPDASFIDGSRRLHVFNNERTGRFVEAASPTGITPLKAIAVADASRRGILDLIALQEDGAIIRLSEKMSTAGWDTAQIARVQDASYLRDEVRLHAADMDNNGAIDLILARVQSSTSSGSQGSLIWLGDEKGNFLAAGKPAGPPLVFSVIDLNSDGRLDLIGLSAEGLPQEALNHGTRSYHWQIIRPRAKQAVGDQRINSFGIGGEIEIRSGLLVQLQPITGPQVHFGLGTQAGVDVARILWPNGSVRAEFALKADQEVVTEQRLKGSCPFLFAYNGKEIAFVKDAVPWGSAIGLRINNIGTASIAGTEEWYKIGHDELIPRDGYYDLRITGELWETYYYDYLGLMVVDHPAGTEIFTDERFVVPANKPRIVVTGPLHKIVQAFDDKGEDVTDIVRNLDGRYLDTFGRGQYQGITRDHYVEVDLGDAVPKEGTLYLVAKGWLHPSDSSINVAMGQGNAEHPHAISLEVPDGHGGWTVARPNLGFPAGRKKICLLDLTNVFRAGTAHRVRLRTNLEVYWDSIEWAQGLPKVDLKITRPAPTTADLHYRGYSAIHQENQSSPELPQYDKLAGTKQPWRDLEGYYTRYGDVRELLAGIDDRYVIMNAGDEMSFRFPAPADPAHGWIRDYVIAGDGWIKDGDYNSTYSRTVLPLPHHDRKEYTTPPGRLEDEWTYRQHPNDWQTYHTRYVTTDTFQNALRSETSR
jgi:tetratricopeptide (TPR) repeat protein